MAHDDQRGSGEEYNCEQHPGRHESDSKQSLAPGVAHWFLIFT
jgi:hypothetical protein